MNRKRIDRVSTDHELLELMERILLHIVQDDEDAARAMMSGLDVETLDDMDDVAKRLMTLIKINDA